MDDGALRHQGILQRAQQKIFRGVMAVPNDQDNQSGEGGFNHGPVLLCSAEAVESLFLSQKTG
jgi:hypothetical protein